MERADVRTFDPREVQASAGLAAKDRGEQPDPAGLAMKERVMASPFAAFDRPWAPDEW